MRKRFLYYWLPVILWAGVICYSSSYANPFSSPAVATVQSDVNAIDIPDVSVRPALPNHGVINLTGIVVGKEVYRRALHVMIYVVLGFVLLRALMGYAVPKAVPLTIIFGMMFALSDEIHQIYVPGRSFQYLDLAADFLGIIIGIASFLLIKWMYNRYMRNRQLPKVTEQ